MSRKSKKQKIEDKATIEFFALVKKIRGYMEQGLLLVDEERTGVVFVDQVDERGNVLGLYHSVFCESYLKDNSDTAAHNLMQVLRWIMNTSRAEKGLEMISTEAPIRFVVAHSDFPDIPLWVGYETPDKVKVQKC